MKTDTFPAHFFISDCNGDLHDTRRPDWASTPLRKGYKRTHSRIKTGALAFDSIRTKCDDGWRVVACEVNYEDTELYDDHTGRKIESAYARAD